MTIGVLSDTHDRLANIDLALSFFKQRGVDLVVHCGDFKSLATAKYIAEVAAQYKLPVKGVLGNNDLDIVGFIEYAKTAPGDFDLHEGVFAAVYDNRIVKAYHGHHKPTLRKLVEENNTILLLGHTHKPYIEKRNDGLSVNPGSTAFAIPRSKAWQPSVAIVDVTKMTADIVYLDASV